MKLLRHFIHASIFLASFIIAGTSSSLFANSINDTGMPEAISSTTSAINSKLDFAVPHQAIEETIYISILDVPNDLCPMEIAEESISELAPILPETNYSPKQCRFKRSQNAVAYNSQPDCM